MTMTSDDKRGREIEDDELKTVIADFLDMGHVDNIIAMFKQEPAYYSWTGEILDDDRFAVRLGVSVLFEELKKVRPNDIHLAVPSLSRQAKHSSALIRGEAVSVLGIIGSDEALAYVRNAQDDPDPQIREIVLDILQDESIG